MLKNIPTRGRLFFVTLAFVLLTAMMALIPGLFPSVKIIATAVVREVLFRLEGNLGIVWDALGSRGPGYTNLHVLTRDGEIGRFPGVLITFQIEMDTTEMPLLCHGQVHFFRSDPSYINLEWQNERCAEQHQIVSLAHYTLNDDGVDAVLPEERMEMASKLLIDWIDEGKIQLQSIRNPKMRELIDPPINP